MTPSEGAAGPAPAAGTPAERGAGPAPPAAAELRVWPVRLPEIREGDDLAALVAEAEPALRDGDVLVVSSKAVSKAEGRTVPAPPDAPGRELARQRAISAETVRVVAERGSTRIVATRHGFVLAAAGVDASNVPADRLVLLPVDPDASARTIRAGLGRRLGVDVAVVVSDTAGRPWRVGVTDIALGAAGFAGLDDLRGRRDRYGNELHTTVVAVVDEVAAAADLVKGKTAGAPVAVLRGLRPRPPGQPDPGIRPLLRPAAEDLFPLGTAEARRDAVTARRSIRRFRPEPVPADVMVHAVAAALTAPAPHHSVPWRFVLVDSPQVRADLLDRMRTAWATDLTSDGFTEAQVARRIRRGDLLREAPSLVVPFCVRDGAHAYPDPRRSDAENAMFLVAMGAGVQNFLVALAAEGVGSCWVSSTLFCPDVARAALQVPDNWDPVGAVAVGYPDVIPPPRPDRVAGEHLLVR